MEKRQKSRFLPIAALVALLIVPSAVVLDVMAVAEEVDLSDWQQEGVPAYGTWTVSTDGHSVVQTVNEGPTMFIGPENVSASAIQGRIKVETTSDDDMIGFVLGHQAPLAANGDDPNTIDTIILDWKQATQTCSGSTRMEGFAVFRIRGSISYSFGCSSPHNAWPCMWGKDPNACPEDLEVLATHYGAGTGWKDNTEYTFEIVYQADRIVVTVKGGTGVYQNGVEVINVTGTFPIGRFGFYNFSQAQVRYSGLTEILLPVARIAPVAPTECQNGGGQVALDGTGSESRAEGAGPLQYHWSAPGIEFDDASSATPTGVFPLGATTVTLTVSDDAGTATTTVVVSVVDTQPPTVSLVRPVPRELYVLDQPLGLAGLGLPTVAVGPLTYVAEPFDQCGILTVGFASIDGGGAVLSAAPWNWTHAPALAEPVEQRTTALVTDVVGLTAEVHIEHLHVGTP